MTFRSIIILAPVVAALSLSACGGEGGETRAQPTPTVAVAEPLTLQVADWDEFTGRFESPQQVGIRARVNGYLQEVHVEDGASVEAGDLLFTLDQRPYRAAYAAARGRAEQARATLRQAQTHLARSEQLREADAVSEEELEEARTGVATARASLAAANAEAEAAALDLEYTEIRSPIGGRLSARTVDPGDLIQGGSAGEPLITVVQTDLLHFPFYAPEAVFLRYQDQTGAGLGAPVEVRLQDAPEIRLTGELNFIDNALQAGTGSILMRAEFDNSDGLIRPGMLGSIRVRGSSPYQAQLVPRAAISSDATRRLVYVVGEDGTANPIPVTLGPVVDNLQVVDGLPAGAQVVVGGLQGLQPGTAVETRPGEIRRQPGEAEDVLAARPRPAASARIVD